MTSSSSSSSAAAATSDVTVSARLTKIETLRSAYNYIQLLTDTLRTLDNDACTPSASVTPNSSEELRLHGSQCRYQLPTSTRLDYCNAMSQQQQQQAYCAFNHRVDQRHQQTEQSAINPTQLTTSFLCHDTFNFDVDMYSPDDDFINLPY